MATVISTPAADERSLARRLRRGAVWVVVGRTLGIGTTVLVGIAVPRFLAPQEYAAFALMTSVIVFASGLAMFGLNGTMVRFLSERLGTGDQGGAARALRVGFRLAIVSSAIVAGVTGLYLAVGGMRWFDLPFDPAVMMLACAGVILLALQQLAAESLRGFHEFRMASVLSGGQFGGPITNILFLAGLVVTMRLVPVDHLTLRIALGLFIAALACTAPLSLACLRHMARQTLLDGETNRTPRSDRDELRRIVAVCTPLAILCGLSFAATQADLWIAGALCAKEDVAQYAAARRLAVMVAMPLQMINLTVMSSIPELYIQGRTADLQRLLRRSALIGAAPSLAALLVILWKPATVLGIIFGEDYRGGAELLVLLSFGQLALVMAGSCGLTLSLTGHQRTALRISLLSAGLLAVAGPLATWLFGLKGLALAVVAATVTECVLQWGITRKLLGVWTHFAPTELFNVLRRWRAQRTMNLLSDAAPVALALAESAAGPSHVGAP
jgi:O-antigen/teichoic acid export membrane protein